MEVTINVNDYVWVRLTASGDKMLRRYLRELLLTDDKVDHHVEICFKPVDGWTRFQLHEVMNIFGSTMYNGSVEHVIKGNKISLLQKPYH